MKKSKSILKKMFIIILLTLCVFVYAQDLGDVNGDGLVNIIDSLLIARYYVGMIREVNPGFIQQGDVNLDSKVDIIDALFIAQFYVGIISTLPPPGVTPFPKNTLNNPFEGEKWYVDREWSSLAAASGGEAISQYNTAIWLDGIYAITQGTGLRGHLDKALDQGADVITFVLSNMPNRDCLYAYARSRLSFGNRGYEFYTTEFIDPVAAICSDDKYKDLNIVFILEPESLPSLITGLTTQACLLASGKKGYIACIQYALNRFNESPNIHVYMDFAHSAWLGWDSNFGPAVDLYTQVLKGTKKGLSAIKGVATNTGYYNPVEEPFLRDPNLQIGGQPMKSSLYYEWNPHFDEKDFANSIYKAFRARGFSEDFGVIIDTSHNGWGGPGRPTRASASSDLNTFVNESRIDRREHRANYCNVKNAGIGFRPQANPLPYVHAYIWAWPPGYSKGLSQKIVDLRPTEWVYKWDPMCGPAEKNAYNPGFGTDALEGAPRWRRWFLKGFEMLLKNAYPPIE